MLALSEVKFAQSCPTLCDPMDYTVHGFLQARILEWVAFPFSSRSSQPRDRTQVSCIAGGSFTSWATREAQESNQGLNIKKEWGCRDEKQQKRSGPDPMGWHTVRCRFHPWFMSLRTGQLGCTWHHEFPNKKILESWYIKFRPLKK